MPTLKLKSGSTGTRSKPTARKTAPARKPAAKRTPGRKPAAASKPVATQASENGAQTRGPKLPEGWSKADFNRVVKDMQRARKAREDAEERLKEAQEVANGMALELLDEGVQMSVISTELELSRQWMYTMLKKRAEEDGIPAPTRSRSKPAAKKSAARKAPAARKPAAKKAPARKAPTRKAPTGRARVRITR